MTWTIEETRHLLLRLMVEEPDEFARHARQVAARVKAGTCTCCPGDGDIELECGHFLCDLCEDHCCLACSFAS